MRIFTSLMIFLVMLLSGCGKKEASQYPCIAVSYEPQAWLLRQIAGDSIDVVTLIPAGSDPETYQPTIGTMKNLADASAYLTLGTPGFENNVRESISDNFPSLPVIDTAGDVEKVYGTHALTPQSQTGYDPHVINSIRNTIEIARSMRDALIKIYPHRSRQLTENHQRLEHRLSTLDKSISDLNLKGKTIVMKHPALSYFARDYGFNQIALETEGKDPTPLQLSARIDSIRSSDPVLMVSDISDYTPRQEELAGILGIKIIKVNLNSDTWIEELKRIADEIDRN